MKPATISPSRDSFLPPVPCSQARCEQLETQITELSAHIHAEYDDSQAWTGPDRA
jgi:hypothetical protein